MHFFSDCEILYGVENLKQKILEAKTIIKSREKNSQICKRKLCTSSTSSVSAMTFSQKRNRVNTILFILIL